MSSDKILREFEKWLKNLEEGITPFSDEDFLYQHIMEALNNIKTKYGKGDFTLDLKPEGVPPIDMGYRDKPEE